MAWTMNAASGISTSLPAPPWRAGAAALILASLTACADWPARNDTPDAGELLQSSLPVAAAALDAGQLDVARRVYLSLSERFDGAPEPFLGLGYIAYRNGDSAAAEKHFLQAAERAADRPALQAEALLGAGRTALVRGRTRAARKHLASAAEVGHDTPSAPWIANGLAVVATLDADYEAAEDRYDEALRLSSGNPRIAANHIRMMVAADRIDDAARTHAQHPPSFWPDDDGAALSRLIDKSRRQRRLQDPASPPQGEARRLDPDLAMRLYLSDASPAQADTPPSAGGALPRPSGLILRLDHWPETSTPPATVGETAPDPADASVSPGAEASLPRRAVPSSSSTAAAGPGSAAPEPEAPRSDSAAPAFSLSGSERAATPSSPTPAAPGAPGATDGHALSESGESAPATPDRSPPASDHSPPTTVFLALGQSRRLPLERDATTVLVASPEVADVRLLAPNVLYVIAKGIGRTSVVVLDERKRIEERVVSVVLDLEPLRTILAAEPDLREVRARRLSRGMALTGVVDSSAAADRALRLAAGALPEDVPIENDLRVAASQQVNLEVQIAEVHRSVTEDLGVNWEAIGARGGNTFGFRIGRLPTDDAGNPVPAVVDGQISPSIYFGRTTADTRVGAMIDALATAGLANVLARPNVTAVSGESASFFSGGERPIPTGYDPDTNTVIFEYKKVGVLLDFVPTVVDTGRIVLTVRPEVSEPDASQPLAIGPVVLPVINVRRAETTVEVGDGESIVIAGLFRNRSSTSEAGLPGLKDVPLLGLLFGTTSIRSNELELIVIVTARLVEPNAIPDDGNTPAAAQRASGYYY